MGFKPDSIVIAFLQRKAGLCRTLKINWLGSWRQNAPQEENEMIADPLCSGILNSSQDDDGILRLTLK